MESHLSPKRLLADAGAVDLIFTTAELNHLTACPRCFDDWSQLVLAAMRPFALSNGSQGPKRKAPDRSEAQIGMLQHGRGLVDFE